MRLISPPALPCFWPRPAGRRWPRPPPTACLRQDMVNGWTVVSDRTLIVTDRVGKKFRMSFTGALL